MKKIAQRLIYAFQFALDYTLYWKMRLDLQHAPSNKLGGKKPCSHFVVQKNGGQEVFDNWNWLIGELLPYGRPSGPTPWTLWHCHCTKRKNWETRCYLSACNNS